MVIYFAEVGGVRAAVDPDDVLQAGVVFVDPDGSERTEWRRRSWRELARELAEHPRRRAVTVSSGVLVPVSCERDASLVREGSCDSGPALALSSAEATLILQVLRETGRPDLAERIAPLLDRCTRTEPPPAGDEHETGGPRVRRGRARLTRI